MKAILSLFLIALIITPSFTLRSGAMNSVSKAQLQKLRNQKGSWASIMLGLAEMHAKAGGPLDQLVDAIEEVVEDLDNKLNKAHADFDKRTAEYEAEVSRIQKLINNAASDIAATAEYLEVLAAQKQQFIVDIANTEKSIQVNEQLTEEAIAVRQKQHADYVAKIPEHEEAIAALDEALEVLSQLTDTGASFAQVKTLKKHFSKFQNKIRKSEDRAFLTALMDLASSNKFADKSAVKRVAQIMQDVKDNLNNSLAQLKAAEEEQQEAHEQDLAQKAAELDQLNNQLVDYRKELELTEERIEDNKEFLAQREADKAQAESDLEDEHEEYEKDTETFEDLVKQFQNEQQACQLALEHLNSSTFADYIGDRMEQDVIIDQPHGAGITVETDPLDLE